MISVCRKSLLASATLNERVRPISSTNKNTRQFTQIMPADEIDRLLVRRIREGDQTAWSDCIARFEGRLLAFVDSRLRNRATSEDVVQETFLGFLIGLPNYDDRTPLDMFLFSIAAHKLTDTLRRQGRRPALSLTPNKDSSDSSGGTDPMDDARGVSSMARSRERQDIESRVLGEQLGLLVEQWMARGEFERLKCMELLFVRGDSNKAAAERLKISEQAVANHKHFVVTKLRDAIRKSTPQPIDWQRFDLAEA